VNAHGASNCALVAPAFTATASPWISSARVVAHHVAADDAVGGGLDDQLHEGALLAAAPACTSSA
jgi:hypothetical protein